MNSVVSAAVIFKISLRDHTPDPDIHLVFDVLHVYDGAICLITHGNSGAHSRLINALSKEDVDQF